jgi:hypothetical protein
VRWAHLSLGGGLALERLREVVRVMPRRSFYDDVYLVAIEAPMSRGQPGTLAKLSRVFGAVVVCVPARVQLWELSPGEWRRGLELKASASKEACAAECVARGAPAWGDQNAYDAWAVAYTARAVNRRALAPVRP